MNAPATRRAPARRRPVAVALAAMLAAGAVVAASTTSGERGPTRQRAGAATAHPHESALVERRDLIATQRFSGTLGHGDPEALVAPRGGLLTGHPPVGAVVGRGQVLYEVDGVGVELFVGPRPFWRPLGPGVSPGPDVRQLEENLLAMGLATPAGLVADERFGAATAAGVRRWQATRGRQPTGVLEPWDVAVHRRAIRIHEVSVPLGAPVAPGAALMAVTGPESRATVEVGGRDLDLVPVGAEVQVELAGGTRVPGRIEAVRAGKPSGDEGGRQGFVVTVTAEVPGGQAIDGAPVDVHVVRRRATGVLVVPVAALLARPGNGYGVEVLAATGRRRVVAVELGLAAGGLVEVRGALEAGERVVVAPT